MPGYFSETQARSIIPETYGRAHARTIAVAESLYSAAELAALPRGAVELALGVGHPVRLTPGKLLRNELASIGSGMMRAITDVMVGVPLVILIGSCSAVETPPTPVAPMTGAATTLDDQFVRMAKLVPEFGGMFLDRDGELNVYMAARDGRRVGGPGVEARRARLEEALAVVFGPEFVHPGVPAGRRPPIRIVDGNYDVLQLVEWRKGLDRALTVPGIVFTDLDERQNRLTIGVEAGAPRELVDAKVRQLGLPADVVVIEESPPIVPYASLVDRLRPVQGGVQIGDGGVIRGGCTLGFNALRGTTSGFVTASHCTRIRGDVGSPILQPLHSQFIDNRIGVEVADPPYFTVGCPLGRICRHSDSAFAAYDNASLSGRNTLVRTRGPNGSITVDNAAPAFTVVGETDMPVLGTVVNKVGRSTGWTAGIVTGTCINVNLVGTNLTYLCQHKVTPTTSPGPRRIGDCGDSGAPVFQVLTDGGVSLHGILCCGAPGGTEFYFSSMASIEAELGALTTVDFPLPPSPEPPRCPGHPNWPPNRPCP
jgi:hypothetical protein